MMNAKVSRWSVVLLVGLLLFNAASQMTIAQEGDAPVANIEFNGLIEAIGDGTITVKQQVVDVRSAQFRVPIQLGLLIEVEGQILADGRVIARRIDDPDDDDDDLDDIEITGILTNRDDVTITIGGQVINIASVQLDDDLIEREVVRARVSRDDDGNWNVFSVDRNIDDDDDTLSVGDDCTIAQPEGWTIYVIRPGDTLSSIANRANTNIPSLTLANCLNNPRFIVAGVQLFVPRPPVIANIRVDDDDDGGSGRTGGNQGGGNRNNDDDDDDGGNDDDD